MKEADVVTGQWYKFSEQDLPDEMLYCMDDAPQYDYMYALVHDDHIQYMSETELYMGHGTIAKMDNAYWMAWNRLKL